jgi:hypothetical protein
MRQITTCSYCIEPLNEDESQYYTNAVHEMPLCTQCTIENW